VKGFLYRCGLKIVGAIILLVLASINRPDLELLGFLAVWELPDLFWRLYVEKTGAWAWKIFGFNILAYITLYLLWQQKYSNFNNRKLMWIAIIALVYLVGFFVAKIGLTEKKIAGIHRKQQEKTETVRAEIQRRKNSTENLN